MIEIVDSADIDQRVFVLPREVSKATSWHIGEMELCGIREYVVKIKENEQVSKSHSS